MSEKEIADALTRLANIEVDFLHHKFIDREDTSFEGGDLLFGSVGGVMRITDPSDLNKFMIIDQAKGKFRILIYSTTNRGVEPKIIYLQHDDDQ